MSMGSGPDRSWRSRAFPGRRAAESHGALRKRERPAGGALRLECLIAPFELGSCSGRANRPHCRPATMISPVQPSLPWPFAAGINSAGQRPSHNPLIALVNPCANRIPTQKPINLQKIWALCNNRAGRPSSVLTKTGGAPATSNQKGRGSYAHTGIQPSLRAISRAGLPDGIPDHRKCRRR